MQSLARLVLVVATAGHFVVQVSGDRLANFWVGAALHLTATLAYIYLCRQAVKRSWKPSFLEAFGLALGLRLLVLPLDPALSDDIFRYLHEGHMVLAGENPYLVPPAEVAEPLRLPSFHRINHATIPAAYPPAVQYVLALGYSLDPSPLGMKVIFGLCDLLVFVVLWFWLPRMKLPSARAVIHGLCPLVVLEFAGEGHSDSLAVLALTSCLFAWTIGRRRLGGALLAVATAGKLLPAVLLPFLWRPAKWAALIFGGVLVVLYSPFLFDAVAKDRSIGDLFTGTLEYGSRWRHNDSAFALAHVASDWALQRANTWYGETLYLSYYPHNVAKAGIGVLGAFWLWHAFRRRWPPVKVVALVFFFFVACTPTLHPWYVAFLVPFLCFYPTAGLLLFTGAVYVAHSVPERPSVEWWVRVLEYLPFYVGLLSLRGQKSRREL